MSQLTFDGMVGNPPEGDDLTVAVHLEAPRKDSWYKGRVLSHSSISMYRQCPQRWKFRYVDRIPERPRSFFSFGKSVHASLEYLFTRPASAWPPVEDLVAHFKNAWLRDGYESAAQEKWFYQEGERILRGFHARHSAQPPRALHVEFKFTFDVEGVPVTGFMDRIDLTEAGGLHIVDYKTGKAFDKSRVRKDPQLTLYQMAARQLLGKDVERLTLYHLNSLTALTVDAHPRSVEDEVRTNVVDAAKGINEGLFDPAPDEKGHCQWCDYAQICPAFSGRKPPAAAGKAREALGPLVDRYGKIDMKIQELQAERAALGESISVQLRQAAADSASGEFFTVRRERPVDGGPETLAARPRPENVS